MSEGTNMMGGDDDRGPRAPDFSALDDPAVEALFLDAMADHRRQHLAADALINKEGQESDNG